MHVLTIGCMIAQYMCKYCVMHVYMRPKMAQVMKIKAGSWKYVASRTVDQQNCHTMQVDVRMMT